MDKKMHVIEDGADADLIHPLEVSTDIMDARTIIIILLIVIGAGITTGFVFSSINKSAGLSFPSLSNHTSQKVKESVGIKDKKTFKDNAEGLLQEGGMEGEGQFHLERPGGTSQNVYLTSTTVDLSVFIGKKIRVWGETFSAQKAGWLMDVGFVEVL